MAEYKIWNERVTIRADRLEEACEWLNEACLLDIEPWDLMKSPPVDGEQQIRLDGCLEPLFEDRSLEDFFEEFACEGSRIDFEVRHPNGYATYATCVATGRHVNFAMKSTVGILSDLGERALAEARSWSAQDFGI